MLLTGMRSTALYLTPAELTACDGAVVTIDVIRAFTTAAYAFAAGAKEIYLVGSVQEALAFKAQHRAALAMGEEAGRLPHGFDLSNSPVQASRADLTGRTLVMRSSAGTRGALAANRLNPAGRQWCASLVCASATARAVSASGLGAPIYLITGRFPDSPVHDGAEDEAAARFIEDVRLGQVPDPTLAIRRVIDSEAARGLLQLGPKHVDPDDVRFATRVDVFGFAMELQRTELGLRLTQSWPS